MTQRVLGHGLRAWLSAHSKLSVGCGRGGLRKEGGKQFASQRINQRLSENQTTKTTYPSKT